MRKRLILLVCCVSIAGCAPDVWDKDGATQASFGQDFGSCKMIALGMAPVQPAYIPPSYNSTTTYNGTYGNGTAFGLANTTTQADTTGQSMANLNAAIATAGNQKQMLRACMESRGYVREVK